MTMVEELELAGYLAMFTEEKQLVEAARLAREAGYREMDAFTPFPVDGLHQALGLPLRHTANWLALSLLLIGGSAGFGLQYYLSVIAYPLNIGGRPLNSWPAFIPITFVTAILFASVGLFIALIIRTSLTTRYRPVQRAPGFDLATRNRFFLYIKRDDAQFDRVQTRAFLHGLQPVEVSEVEA
jgi:hypothetical protein